MSAEQVPSPSSYATAARSSPTASAPGPPAAGDPHATPPTTSTLPASGGLQAPMLVPLLDLGDAQDMSTEQLFSQDFTLGAPASRPSFLPASATPKATPSSSPGAASAAPRPLPLQALDAAIFAAAPAATTSRTSMDTVPYEDYRPPLPPPRASPTPSSPTLATPRTTARGGEERLLRTRTPPSAKSTPLAAPPLLPLAPTPSWPFHLNGSHRWRAPR